MCKVALWEWISRMAKECHMFQSALWEWISRMAKECHMFQVALPEWLSRMAKECHKNGFAIYLGDHWFCPIYFHNISRCLNSSASTSKASRDLWGEGWDSEGGFHPWVPWEFHELQWEFPWELHGLQWEFPWEFSWEFCGNFMGFPWEFQGGSVVWIYQMIHLTSSGLILRYLQDEWFFVFFFEVKLAWQIQVWLYGYVSLKKVVVSWFCRPRFLLTLGSTNNLHIPMIAILHIQKKCF